MNEAKVVALLTGCVELTYCWGWYIWFHLVTKLGCIFLGSIYLIQDAVFFDRFLDPLMVLPCISPSEIVLSLKIFLVLGFLPFDALIAIAFICPTLINHRCHFKE